MGVDVGVEGAETDPFHEAYPMDELLVGWVVTFEGGLEEPTGGVVDVGDG